MQPKTTTRLTEKLDRSRSADEALDTIIAALAMLNGDRVTPAPLGRLDVLRDLRSSLLTLHVVLGGGPVTIVPSLRASLKRCALLGKPIDVDLSVDVSPAVKGIESAIEVLQDLSADKDRRLTELKAELAALDDDDATLADYVGAVACATDHEALNDGLAAEAADAVRERMPWSGWALGIAYTGVVLLAGYFLAAWWTGVL